MSFGYPNISYLSTILGSKIFKYIRLALIKLFNKKVSTVVWGLAHVSGANFNPAVTLALLAIGETNIVRVLLYIPCQLLGSTAAVITLKELFAPPGVITRKKLNYYMVKFKIFISFLFIEIKKP